MNLGVETMNSCIPYHLDPAVSAFSDESWGGDRAVQIASSQGASCFSIL